MGIQSGSQYMGNPNANWIVEENKSGKWSSVENKEFEKALARYDEHAPDRWQKVAAVVGRTIGDVMRQYKKLEDDINDIEAGLVSVPEYNATPSFTLDYWVNSGPGFDVSKSKGPHRKRFSTSSSGRPSENERKKGVPWSEEEHKKFLRGLHQHGRGDWRNISRNFVMTRTPTQVASHAQKYFIRQLSAGKDKRRASIHDITTANLADPITSPTPTPAPTPAPTLSSPSPPQYTASHRYSSSPSQLHQWSHQQPHAAAGGGVALAAFSDIPAHDNGKVVFMSPNFGGVDGGGDHQYDHSYGFGISQDQNLHTNALLQQAQNMVFQFP